MRTTSCANPGIWPDGLRQASSAMDLHNLHPSLLSYAEPSDFDYVAFLQGDSVEFQDPLAAHGLSDSSGKTTPPSSDNRHSSVASSELIPRLPAQKQRLERRGHTKSRRGCYNCKRRRIKVTLVPPMTEPVGQTEPNTSDGIVPGESPGMRPLRQDGLEVRIPIFTTNNTSSKYALRASRCHR